MRPHPHPGPSWSLLVPLLAALLTATLWLPRASAAETDLVRNPGFEQADGWAGTQNAGKALFERTREQAHSGEWSAKVVCKPGDVYARWVYSAPGLFTGVKRRDVLRLSFRYRASAALGDALVQINQTQAPGWRQYQLKRLQATGDNWLRYEAVFKVDVDPNGSGEVQLRGTTSETGEQVAYFDDVSLEVIGHEDPRLDVLELGDPGAGLSGAYHPDGRITFDSRPTEEWQFMATGTGVTGLTVSFPAEMVVQVNHSAAIDEQGRLRALGRVHIDLEGHAFATATSFRMEHDLRRSVIRAVADTPEGTVRVEIRAHVPQDAIRIDIDDLRRKPTPMTVRLEEDAPSKAAFTPADGLRLWHENPASGSAINAESRAWLGGRTFGLCVFPAPQATAPTERALQTPAAARQTLYLLGVSAPGGRAAFAKSLTARLADVRGQSQEQFVTTHEAWWKAFWSQAECTVHDPSGRMLRYQAAFDLYRYYLHCCANDRRETPVRFQIDLFRYHTRYNDWMTGLICAVEQYQSFYGAMRTGDWGPLRNLASFYQQNLGQYRQLARRTYGHSGARIPMWQTPLVLQPPDGPAPSTAPTGVPKAAYNGENPAGALWVLALLCDYVAISGDGAFADATLRPLASDLVEFVRLQYPQRENGRMVIAPCNAGETWQGVRDPAEMVCALRMALPPLVALGKTRHWDAGMVAQWQEMLTAPPEVPRGRFDYRGPAVRPAILPGDQLAPAADMSGCEAYVLPWSEGKPHYQLNAQQTELFAIWPAKLGLRDPATSDSAVRSYRERLFQHQWDGWNLDVVFAACLGLQDEVGRWFDEHFDHTFVLPCGLARETAQGNPTCAAMPESPSMQGMGTGVIPVLEMLLQDYPDELVVLPCWPEGVGVDSTLYSPYAGRVAVRYQPGKPLRVTTERPIRVTTNPLWKVRPPITHEVTATRRPKPGQ